MQIILEVLNAGLVALKEYFIINRFISLFIAFSLSGAIAAFMSQGAIVKYFGPNAKKGVAYLVASVSGALLTVCSCSVLPMFASIRKKGAGLGPAVAFLFSGPAVNILAVIMTFTLIGTDIGLARIISAVILAIVIGFIMFAIFRKSEVQNKDSKGFQTGEALDKPILQTSIFLLSILAVLVLWYVHWIPTIIMALMVVVQAIFLLDKDDALLWGQETLSLVKKIIPLFIIGIFIAGVIGYALTEDMVAPLVGNNTYPSNLLAGTFGAFMYFATLTEVPIINTFINDLGMHKGPAIALLLAGPTLSIPNMIVISRVLGLKKSTTYFVLVITLSALAGLIAGLIIGG